ncbi:MAG: L,D-transpeptidase family protein [Thermoleophilia bacterium]
MRPLASRIKLAAIIIGSAIALAAVATVLLVVVLPPRISVSPGDGESEIGPDRWLEINTSRWGASLTTVSVEESKIAPDGTRDGGHLISGHLEDGRFVADDGSNPLESDAEYQVTVTGTVKHIGISGVSDKAVTQTNTFTTVTTPMPIIPKAGLTVKYGEDLVIHWNIPISKFEYQLDGIQSTSSLDDGGTTAHIKLAKFEQGKQYPLKITAVTSNNGRELMAPVVTVAATTAPLKATFDPADGAGGASTGAHPTIIFSEPVSNPDLVKTLVSVDPQVPGTFNWAGPDKLEFIPNAPWDHLQDVTMHLKGGPQAFRGISGGFVESDASSTFTTAPSKSIDVNVTTQTVTLLEDGKPIDSFAVATGAAATPTPLGDYTIYAKIAATDMRGPGYFAPHVPWVMVFYGDDALHGNYWNTSFGTQGSGGSHGCVGMPVDTAKRVYDWAPMGTPVHIHE